MFQMRHELQDAFFRALFQGENEERELKRRLRLKLNSAYELFRLA
jgi:hypothetical protein